MFDVDEKGEFRHNFEKAIGLNIIDLKTLIKIEKENIMLSLVYPAWNDFTRTDKILINGIWEIHARCTFFFICRHLAQIV